MNCAAKYNPTVFCAGDFMESQGCCLKHAVLFDIWIAEFEGFRVYQTDYPRNWKRSKFHEWLNKIGPEVAQKLFER